MGWPFLAGPVERLLSRQLQRPVSFAEAGEGGVNTLRIHLLGGVGVTAGSLRIGAPLWSAAGQTLVASNAELRLRYHDLWAARNGGGLRVEALRAARLDAVMERLADGRASWQFGLAQGPAQPGAALRFDRLEIDEGLVKVDDAVLKLQAQVDFGLADSASAVVAGTAASAASAAASASPPAPPARGLHAQAKGRYRGNALSASLSTGSVLPWVAGDEQSPTVAMKLRLQAGPARASFDGSVRELLGFGGLRGAYTVSGPSLASFGEPLGVTLPTTAAFRMDGDIVHEGRIWKTVVRRGTVGRSELNGEFSFDPRDTLPLLSGRLGGKALLLADLAPAIGASTPAAPAAARADGKVLPNKRFDLPSLRAMDADVRVDLARLELGAAFAEPLTPVQGRLQLQDGVLSLTGLVARTAQGRISGDIRLDGRPEAALWDTQLRWSGLALEQWIKQARAAGRPPYASGRLGGQLALKGTGRSTAELLGTAQGSALVHWTRGSISHLAVEAAGIDLAQSLGVLIRGDDSLPVTCGAADLRFERGTVTPKVMLVDTKDSTVWVDGSLSLATEKLDLRARVSPKDFSPLALRTPVLLKGSLGKPDISLAKGPLAQRLVPAVLLALVNPLAGLLPLMDTGDPSNAEAALAGCRALIARVERPAKAAR
ncbi:MAG TPA: AsmA family protein [Ideonella sp.]|nr:AsmA family protein [Ideonella sp.]